MTAAEGGYLAPEEYDEVIADLTWLAMTILQHFREHSQGIRDVIIGNFIARGITCLHSIQAVWKLDHFQDAYVLYRCLLDRLFHLYALSQDDEFEVFEQWSFVQQYERRNRALSDPELRDRLDPKLWRPTESQKKRYRDIKRADLKWKRPQPEDTAKSMDLRFLYSYGYDFGSAHVHPMATDGQEDFVRLTEPGKVPTGPDQRVLLNNSCLAMVILLNEGLNASRLRWMSLVYDVLDAFVRSLRTASWEYKGSLAKLKAITSSGKAVCRRPTNS